MKILGVIPARYGSTRLEGKPLKDIRNYVEATYSKHGPSTPTPPVR